MRVIWIALWCLLFVSLLPLIIALAGAGAALALGCDLGASDPVCMVLGLDVGPALSTMMMLHWFVLITLPLAAIAVIGLAIMGVIALVRRVRG